MLEEVANKREFEIRKKWCSGEAPARGTNDLWKELCGKMEEEVLDMFQEVKEAKKDALMRLNGESSKKRKTYQPRKWEVKTAGLELSYGSDNTLCSETKVASGKNRRIGSQAAAKDRHHGNNYEEK